MQFLKKQQRFNALLDKYQIKLVKIKQSDDTRMRRIVLKFDIPITNDIKKQLDHRVQPLLNEKETNTETAVDGVKIREKQNCWLWIFEQGNFKSSTENAIIAVPEGTEGAAEVTITGIKPKDGDWFLQLEVMTPFTEQLNTFAARNCLDGSMNLLMRPQQKDLPLEGNANEGSKQKSTKKKKSLKKKDPEPKPESSKATAKTPTKKKKTAKKKSDESKVVPGPGSVAV